MKNTELLLASALPFVAYSASALDVTEYLRDIGTLATVGHLFSRDVGLAPKDNFNIVSVRHQANTAVDAPRPCSAVMPGYYDTTC